MTKIFNKDSIIYLDGFVYLVDREAKMARKGQWVYEDHSKVKSIVQVSADLELPNKPYNDVLVVATNNPSLEGVPKLPDLEKYEMDRLCPYGTISPYEIWTEGYEAASKKKYSEEDMRKAIQMARETSTEYGASMRGKEYSYQRNIYKEDFIIQSLTPKIKEIELEMEEDKYVGLPAFVGYGYPKLKLDDRGNLIVKNIVYE